MNETLRRAVESDPARAFRAAMLLSSVDESLARGVRHFDKSGRPLLTAREVLVAFRDEGQVMIEEPEA